MRHKKSQAPYPKLFIDNAHAEDISSAAAKLDSARHCGTILWDKGEAPRTGYPKTGSAKTESTPVPPIAPLK